MGFTKEEAQWHADNGTWVKPKWWYVIGKGLLGAGGQDSTIFNPITGFRVVGRVVEAVEHKGKWRVRVVWAKEKKDSGAWFFNKTRNEPCTDDYSDSAFRRYLEII